MAALAVSTCETLIRAALIAADQQCVRIIMVERGGQRDACLHATQIVLNPCFFIQCLSVVCDFLHLSSLDSLCDYTPH